MNDNTRRQWERYSTEQEPPMPWRDRWVLYWLVHDHSAREGFTRPGYRRLVEVTRLSNNGVVASLRRLTADGHIVPLRIGAGHRATEYAIPWLRNPQPRRNESANESARRSANESTSTPLRGVGAHAVSASRARHPSFADQFQAKPRPEIAGYDDCAPDQFLIR